MTFSILGYFVIGIVTVLAAVMVLRSTILVSSKGTYTKAKKGHSSGKSSSKPVSYYQTTAIVSGKTSCEAVKAIEGKRFLDSLGDFPKLPLANCNAGRCICKYEHHLDRRDTDDIRRAPPGLRSQLHPHIENVERRLKRGRRTSDWD